jgi:Aerotolerance regulator N-terminal/von Willebrand factor type A domain
MSFLYPAFLVGSVAIALPIILHLLRRDVAPEVPFTAVRLLRRSAIERPARRRLRELVLLIARVIALLLLAIAFARPYIQGATPANVRVVAIDRSYSMTGGDRFARALDAARAAIDATGSGDRVALIAFDDRAEVLAQPGGASDARASLASVRAGFGATRYGPVFAKALELGAGARGHVVIVSDLQRSGWDGQPPARLPASWQVDVQDVGGVDANLAITAVDIQRDSVVATVRNSGSSARTGTVHAVLDGRDVAQATYAVAANGTARVPIAWRAPNAGALAVSIDDPEGFQADNTRYVALGSQGAIKTLVVTTGGQSGAYLARALGTTASDTDTTNSVDADVATGARVAELTADQLANYPVVALLSTRAVERRVRDAVIARVQQGAGLLLAAGPDLDAGVVSGLTEWKPAVTIKPDEGIGASNPPSLTLAVTDLRHPIFRPFGALMANLGQVRFERAWRVSPEGWTVLARFSNGTPALMERPLGQGRVLLFASDVDRRWNDLPLHPAFVPFAVEAVKHLAGLADRRRARDYTVAQVPAGIHAAPGVYRTPDGRPISVNVDVGESGLERLSREAFAEMVQRSGETTTTALELHARQTESRQSYWQYGVLIMIAALVAESFVGRA